MEPKVFHEKMMTPGEVAALFRVDAKTVTRWARNGKMRAYLTPGGHHRFDPSEVRDALEHLPLVHHCGR